MRHTPSKHENMPKVMAILRENPKARIADLAKIYNIPDATIRGVWRNEQIRIKESEELQRLMEKVDNPIPPNKIILRETDSSPDLNGAAKNSAFFSSDEGMRMVVWPDPQVKPGIDLAYCGRVGKYVAHKKPDVFLIGGDFADMPSLSSYDQPGSRGMEGQRYTEDILSVQNAMRLLMAPIREEIARNPSWHPRLVMLLGNHEDRIRRAIEATPKLDGVIGPTDLRYEDWGFEVHPFLKEVVIGGVCFSHYFCSGVMGRPITSARALLTKKHMSCFAFHQQGRDIAFGQRADGKQLIAIIAGSGYEHDEAYLNHQTNNHWRGLYVLNDLIDGEFEEMAVSLKYLKRKYG